jgi:putative endonuclease
MASQRQSYVYMMSNMNCTVLYIGVTAQLAVRIHQHKRGETEGFTKRYGLTRLVWFETFGDIRNAIAREKQLKGWKRVRKNALVAAQNPDWRDLAADW